MRRVRTCTWNSVLKMMSSFLVIFVNFLLRRFENVTDKNVGCLNGRDWFSGVEKVRKSWGSERGTNGHELWRIISFNSNPGTGADMRQFFNKLHW